MDLKQLSIVIGVLLGATTVLLNLGKILGAIGTAWTWLFRRPHSGDSAAIPTRTIVPIVESRINALWWAVATAEKSKFRQVVGDFVVTNTWSKEVLLVNALIRYRHWLVFSKTTKGEVMVKSLTSPFSGRYPIPPHGTTTFRAHFMCPVPSAPEAGDFVADIAVVDQLNNHHWIKRLRFKHPDKMLP